MTHEPTIPMKSKIRETDRYSGRNTSMGALIDEAERVFGALRDGQSLDLVKQRCFDGSLLKQRTEKSRRRIWASLTHRYFAHGTTWAIEDIVSSSGNDHSAFVDLLYLHYCLRDLLTFDLVTKVLANRNYSDRPSVTKDDVRHLLDDAAESQPKIQQWAESSRSKLSNSVLTALRDFGLLEGKIKKYLVKRPLTDIACEHLLRILVGEGQRGHSVISDPTWKLFLLSEYEVSAKLGKLAQSGRIRFEKAGRTVVLETPSEWEDAA
jgi:hypothetical protein